MTTSESSSGWSEYWQNESVNGEVFVASDGSAHPVLAQFWRETLTTVATGGKVLDIASGAGSVYRNLPDDHQLSLYATDIAAEALAALKARMPGVDTTVSGADALPYQDKSFDLVVSQYGVEYAGSNAILEAARLVKTGGRLVLISHIVDGYIDSSNQQQLAAAKVVNDTDFIAKGVALSEVAFNGTADDLAASEANIIPVIRALETEVKRCPRGVHVHLLGGFRQLYENRRQYDEIDLTDWLRAMQGEVDKTTDRLTRMRAAALSVSDTERLGEGLITLGFADPSVEVFNTPGNAKPVAWRIEAYRTV